MVIEHGKRSMVLDCKYGTRHYIVYVQELHFQRVLILAKCSSVVPQSPCGSGPGAVVVGLCAAIV